MKGRKYVKLQIFLFLFFIVVAVVFITQVIGFTRDGINTINEKKKEIKCHTIKYNINDIYYKDKLLIFEIVSMDYSTNISSLTIISDTKQEHKELLIPPLSGGDIKIITKHIEIDDEFFIFVENCKNQGQYYETKK